jgi:O-methyltransferase
MIRSLAELALEKVLVRGARRRGVVRRALGAAAIRTFGRLPDAYEEVRAEFLRAGEGTQFPPSLRREIVRRFEAIDQSVNITSSSTDGLFVAHAVLGLDVPGAIVECGCFTGGSTAKLSIVARLTGRPLVVFDSFEGLPSGQGEAAADMNLRRGGEMQIDWKPGLYDARLDLVRANVERHGELSVCRFIKGWFSETLTPDNVPAQIGLAFTDVDLAPSARDCVLGLWPRLAEGGVFFSHDAPFPKVLSVFADPEVWQKVDSAPPVVLGAGYGLGDASPFLAMMVKGELSNERLAAVTLPMYCRTTPHRQHGDEPRR